MTATELEKMRFVRVKEGKRILAEAHRYKVCDQCRSISALTAGTCAVCKAYRWDETRSGLESAVRDAWQHAFPATLGYAPSVNR